jgi:hypothetical protein
VSNTLEMPEPLKVSPETVMRDWRFAKAWLARELRRGIVGMAGKMPTTEVREFAEKSRSRNSVVSVRSVVNLLFAAQEEMGS